MTPFLYRFKSFSFDAASQPTGYTVVTHSVEMEAGGDTYTSSGVAQIYTMSGVQIATGCSSGVGTRFTV